MNNGKTKWLLWAAGIIMTIIIGVVTFMGNVIYANEDKRVGSEKEIVNKIHIEDEKIRTEIKRDLKEIRTEQRRMAEKMNTNQTELLVAIESLKK